MTASNNDSAAELLIQEVDEDLRRDQYAKLWKRYGNWMIGGAIGIVLVVAANQGWQYWQNGVRQKEAAQFSAAQALADAGKLQDAVQALDKLAADSHTGFAMTAEMRRAELLATSGDAAGAIAAYDKLAASSAKPLYRDLAVIKSALLSIDQGGDLAPVEAKLSNLLAASNPWHFAATEALAMLAQKKGDANRAINLYKQLADDLEAPQGVRARAAEMLAALGAGDKVKG